MAKRSTPKMLTVESSDLVLQHSSTGDRYFGEPIETDSDSGDSLFITQHPVPEAKRPRNTHRRSRMSSVVSAEVDSSPSDSDANCGVTEPPNIRKHSLPKYVFPFLLERRKRTELIYRHNKSLHAFTIGGFFKCVKELWESGQKGPPSIYPTLDMDGEDISPLSENEDEMSASAEIKVVEKKRLVSTLKAIPIAQKKKKRAMGETEKSNPDGQKVCGEKQGKCGKHLSEMDTQDGPLHLFQAEGGTSDTRMSATHTRGNAASVQAAELSDSDTTVCYLLEPKIYRSKERTCRKASLRIDEQQARVFHTEDPSQAEQLENEPESQTLLQCLPDAADVTRTKDCVLDGSKAKKRKKKKNTKDDEDVDQVRTVSEHGDVGLKKKKRRKIETPLDVAVPPGEEAKVRACTSHVMEGETECGLDNTKSSQIGLEAVNKPDKKPQKDRNDSEDLSWSQDILSKECTAQSVEKRKKKKDKMRESISEGVDILPAKLKNVCPHGGDTELGFEKKKEKKRGTSWNRIVLESTVEQSDDSVSALQEKGTSSFLTADIGGKDFQTYEDQVCLSSPPKAFTISPTVETSVSTTTGEAESAESSSRLEESTDWLKKKKKKKRKL